MEEALISIIIPTYGRPISLKKSINSVLNQTYKNWEIIIVDDNNPNTLERLETEKEVHPFLSNNRIKYIKHERNKNGSAARNTGFLYSKGEYVTFLDDDDEFFVTRLEKCYKSLKNTSDNIAGVYTGCVFLKNGDEYRSKNNAKSGNFLVECLATTFQSHSGSNLFFKRRVIEELKGFDESFTRHQDYELLVRVFQKYSFIGIKEILLKKNETWSNLPDIDKFYDIKKQYLGNFISIINNLSLNERKEIYYCNYISLALLALEKRNLKKFYKFLKISLGYRFIKTKDLLRIFWLFIFK